jgi:ADP-heptose:LPS heptosyltransferase
MSGPLSRPPSRPLNRVVILRALGLGDLCTGIPAVRGISRAFPGHEIVLAAPAWQEPIARACGVDRVIDVVGTGPLADLGPVDVAINLHGFGPESTRRLLAVNPQRLLAYRHPDLAETRTGPRWRVDDHEIERWCRLLTHHGIACDITDMRLDRPTPPDQQHVGAVVVHPGAASTGRRWPAERFATVVRSLSERGVPVVLTGSAVEAGLCAMVRELAGDPTGVTSLAGHTDLEQLCSLVAGARAVVSNDTGVAHLATVYGVPSVTIFGPTSPRRWGPRDRSQHRCLWAGCEGDPHAIQLDPGLAKITVEQVLSAMDDVLAGSSMARP